MRNGLFAEQAGLFARLWGAGPKTQALLQQAGFRCIGDLQRNLVVRDRDLELLLGAAHDEAEGGESTDDFAKLVQGCIDHLGCEGLFQVEHLVDLDYKHRKLPQPSEILILKQQS